MYVLRNVEARSFNHFCSGKAITITYCVCVCVFVALGIQHAICMHLNVVSGLRGSKMFFYII